MPYVDGFLLPLPKRKVNAYLAMSRKAGKVWKEYGALEYRECVGDDLNIKNMTGFPKVVKTTAGETVVFSWIVYKSRAHRDAVNKKVMSDPAIAEMCGKKMPFDVKRMVSSSSSMRSSSWVMGCMAPAAFRGFLRRGRRTLLYGR